ncbi:hypothetical protein BDV19DRAFT_401130 [Aspergillus venezuelensis]
MAQVQKYAKDQPAGFTNRIERVAIVGAGGSIGKPIAQELLKTGRHTVTALTRSSSANPLPEGIKSIEVDYGDESSLINALRGQHFLIITLAVTTPPDTEGKLIRAAAAAGVPYIMPNAYGWDVTNESIARDIPIPGHGGFKEVCESVSKDGQGLSWIALVCGFWYEFSLVNGVEWFGFDFANKKVTFYNDGNTKINVSTWEQCGRAVAGLLSLKELPDDEDDQAPSVSAWRNKPVYMDSFAVSQRDMFESWKRVTGDKDSEWTVEYEGSKERWARGCELLKNGDRRGLAMAMYARVFFENGDGNYGERNGLQSEVLGLPREDLDERTRVARGMLERGYSYFGNRV